MAAWICMVSVAAAAAGHVFSDSATGSSAPIYRLWTGCRPQRSRNSRRQPRANALDDTHVGLEFVVFVRINSWRREPLAEADLRALRAVSWVNVVVPMAQTAHDLQRVNGVLGTSPGRQILALIETAVGLAALPEIAAARQTGLGGLILGQVDLANDLGVDLIRDHPLRLFAGAQVVLTARTHGLVALDGPWLDVRDVEGCRADSRRSRDLGFAGRVILHPCQIEPALSGYTVDNDRLVWGPAHRGALRNRRGAGQGVHHGRRRVRGLPRLPSRPLPARQTRPMTNRHGRDLIAPDSVKRTYDAVGLARALAAGAQAAGWDPHTARAKPGLHRPRPSSPNSSKLPAVPRRPNRNSRDAYLAQRDRGRDEASRPALHDQHTSAVASELPREAAPPGTLPTTTPPNPDEPASQWCPLRGTGSSLAAPRSADGAATLVRRRP